MRIAISGPNASGVTTVTDLVAQRTGLKPITYTLVDLAREQGLTREQLDERKEKEFPKVDYQLDKQNVQAAGDGTAFGSDIAVWLVDADLRVWIHASPRIRAARLAGRDKIPLAEAVRKIRERDSFYAKHYKRLYGINWLKPWDQVHLVVNTAAMDAHKVAQVIATAAQNAPFARDARALRKIKRIQKLIQEGG